MLWGWYFIENGQKNECLFEYPTEIHLQWKKKSRTSNKFFVSCSPFVQYFNQSDAMLSSIDFYSSPHVLVHATRLSSIFSLCLPLNLLASVFPVVTRCSTFSHVMIQPKNFACLFLILLMRLLSASTSFRKFFLFVCTRYFQHSPEKRAPLDLLFLLSVLLLRLWSCFTATRIQNGSM